MSVRHRRWVLLICPVIAASVLPALSGCRKEEPRVEVLTFEGKLESIRWIKNQPGVIGEITVRFQSEKHSQQEVHGKALVRVDTEILINGVVARLEDVREGECGLADVRVDKSGDKPTYTMLRIRIDRAQPIDVKGD